MKRNDFGGEAYEKIIAISLVLADYWTDNPVDTFIDIKDEALIMIQTQEYKNG